MINVKRVYEPSDAHDGKRFLVDRIWPRGLKKEDLQLDGWLKNVAPSAELRRWFGHDPDKWPEFQRAATLRSYARVPKQYSRSSTPRARVR
jgi:uncharacterized protein YeaO (DUF488 family)